MNNDEMEYLEKAVNNEKNDTLLNLTFDIIDREKREILELEELHLTKKEINVFLKKLDDYRYIKNFKDLQYGNFIRWINLNDPENINLVKVGGVVCQKDTDDGEIIIKNPMNRYFQINIEENLIFQKFSDQERIILYAVDHLNK